MPLVPAAYPGPDHDIEVAVSVQRKVPKCTGIQIPPLQFQFIDDFHGPDFRCSGYGTAGEKAVKKLRNLNILPPPSDDCAHQVKDSGIVFDDKMLRNLYAAGFADVIQVVALQVYDHQELAAIFG